jgi:predicted nucleic acid-binding protein
VTGYLDASALLAVIFDDHSQPVDLSQFDDLVSSELLPVECLRACHRVRHRGTISAIRLARVQDLLARILARVHLGPLDGFVLDGAARNYPGVVGTLDAIHLATALRIRSDGEDALQLLTHDAQLGRVARSCGLDVVGV